MQLSYPRLRQAREDSKGYTTKLAGHGAVSLILDYDERFQAESEHGINKAWRQGKKIRVDSYSLMYFIIFIFCYF